VSPVIGSGAKTMLDLPEWKTTSYLGFSSGIGTHVHGTFSAFTNS
jgi:hypothetical protein